MAIRKVALDLESKGILSHLEVINWCRDNWGPQDRTDGHNRWWYRKQTHEFKIALYLEDDDIDIVEFKLRWL